MIMPAARSNFGPRLFSAVLIFVKSRRVRSEGRGGSFRDRGDGRGAAAAQGLVASLVKLVLGSVRLGNFEQSTG